jgi:hypothetical protein
MWLLVWVLDVEYWRVKAHQCEENSHQLMQLVACVPMVNKFDKGMVMKPYNFVWESNVEHRNTCISASVPRQNSYARV